MEPLLWESQPVLAPTLNETKLRLVIAWEQSDHPGDDWEPNLTDGLPYSAENTKMRLNLAAIDRNVTGNLKIFWICDFRLGEIEWWMVKHSKLRT